MKRKKKIDKIAEALKINMFGLPLTDVELRWLAEHILDALLELKIEKTRK